MKKTLLMLITLFFSPITFADPPGISSQIFLRKQITEKEQKILEYDRLLRAEQTGMACEFYRNQGLDETTLKNLLKLGLQATIDNMGVKKSETQSELKTLENIHGKAP